MVGTFDTTERWVVVRAVLFERQLLRMAGIAGLLLVVVLGLGAVLVAGLVAATALEHRLDTQRRATAAVQAALAVLVAAAELASPA